jgi:hypothetical protein
MKKETETLRMLNDEDATDSVAGYVHLCLRASV